MSKRGKLICRVRQEAGGGGRRGSVGGAEGGGAVGEEVWAVPQVPGSLSAHLGPGCFSGCGSCVLNLLLLSGFFPASQIILPKTWRGLRTQKDHGLIAAAPGSACG